MPSREGRNWIHPSELPTFDAIPTYDMATRRRQLSPLVLASAVVIFTLGSVTLALKGSSPPASGSLKDHEASSLHQLPSYIQNAARSIVELVVTVDGHVSATAAMVISPGNLAVTTTPIPSGASIIGSSEVSNRFRVTLIGHDQALGFTILRLAKVQPITPTALLPASASVAALSSYFSPNASTPAFVWTMTTLGDPVRESTNGVVSYLATQSAPNLQGIIDAVAVDNNGMVVAVLSGHNQWYSAQYLTKVAQSVAQNGGCHALLGIAYESAQGGGVVVTKVMHGPSWGRLHHGDILLRINGDSLDSMDSLLAYLYASRAHHHTSLMVIRDGRTLLVDVVLGCRP